jgi:membrane protein implicated in regulation of membrane protease activity
MLLSPSCCPILLLVVLLHASAATPDCPATLPASVAAASFVAMLLLLRFKAACCIFTLPLGARLVLLLTWRTCERRGNRTGAAT